MHTNKSNQIGVNYLMFLNPDKQVNLIQCKHAMLMK